MSNQKKFLKQVGHFRLMERIGRGASAIVYLGIDDKKDELVAVKAIPNEKLNKDNGAAMLQRELKTLHKLKHDNIIKIKGNEKTSHNNYVILEYCNGGNLYEYKNFYEREKKCNLNELFIQKIIRQLTEGLEYMHSQNIIHRDIKLENILLNFNKYPNKSIKGNLPPKVDYKQISLNDSFTIKIADLGYSKDLEGGDVASTILGSPLYMSPDIVGKIVGADDGDKKYNSSIDLWSLGAITYELLTKNPPFTGKDYNQIFSQVMKGTYKFPSNLVASVEIITFINGLLQYYPEKRLNWAQIKNHPFLTKSVETFNYIQLKGLTEKDKTEIEMNSKDCDNLLWILFRGANNKMKIDKVNDKEVKNDEMKNNIKDNIINNEEIKKALEQEKKKLEEERQRLKIEREEAEKLKKEAETMRKNAKSIQDKNKEELKKLQEENKKKKELEEKLKKDGELNAKKAEEIKKQLNEYEEKIKEVESKTKEGDEKLQKAEKMLKEAELTKKNAENQIIELNKQKLIEGLKVKKEEEKFKEKEKLLMQEKLQKEEEIEKLKKLQKEKEEEFKQEKLNLTNQINEMNNIKEELKNESNKNKEVQDILQKKELSIKELENKLQAITDEKNKQIEMLENEKKELELLEEKIRYKETLKSGLLSLEDFDDNDNLNINSENKDKKDDELNMDEWVFYYGEDAQSIEQEEDRKEKEELLKEYEVVEYYKENENEPVETSEKIEI